jgi:hypothetical protein
MSGNLAVESLPITLQAASEPELRALLGLAKRPTPGATTALASGVELRVEEALESKGMAGSEMILTGVVTVLTKVAADLLITWLKTKIEPRRNEVTIIIRDEVVTDFSESALRRLIGVP